VTALIDGKKVLGPQKQIREVQNAVKLYEEIESFDPTKEDDLFRAHKQLMQGLTAPVGQYHITGVGVFKGSNVSHVAPPAKQVPHLMKQLFTFLNDKEISWLLKACIFHYELEFIHPFMDGNGRMGRLWQQLLLMKHSPIFEFVSVETLIHKKQNLYYKTLERCDKAGNSTEFIEFSLEIILVTLEEFKKEFKPQKPKIEDRIQIALEHFGKKSFTRKEYIQLHRGLSTATASRDLADAVKKKLLIKIGDKIKATYKSR
jgi:Fic family protein